MNLKKILSRGVAEIIGEKELVKKLESDPSKIVIKYGVDPTRPDIHLGHAVCLRKLREFQDLGCKIVFLIGDFTALIGDPSGKSKLRPEVGLAEIHRNMETYTQQASKVLDWSKLIVLQNSSWYLTFDDIWISKGKPLPFFANTQNLLKEYVSERSKWESQINKVKQFVSLKNVIANLRKVTNDQLVQRDMFAERQKQGEPIYMNEMLYPVLQGIDSLVIANALGSCDCELGGSDQYFNMLMGRQIIEREGNSKIKPQSVITLPILEGVDGKEKMSKSLDNYIGIAESPRDIFGKTMRIPDALIPRWVELTTALDEQDFEERLKKENPRDLKIELAKELVKIYWGEAESKKAQEEFERMFSAKSGGGKPNEIPSIQIEEGSWGIAELLLHAKLVDSKSEARRLIQQGGVKVNDRKIESFEKNFKVGKEELILQVGKRKWAKIVS